jgi:hypothetical protein
MSAGTSQTIWGIHAGKTGDAHSLFLNKNVVAVGWTAMGDLSAIPGTREAFKAAVAKTYPNRKTMTICDDLLTPKRLWTRSEVLSRPSPVPNAPGIYGWYFRSLHSVPTSACCACGDFVLLYIGISPSPSRPGHGPSKRSLYERIPEHMNGNAFGSTLRLSLGCLLADELGIELRRVGSGDRLTFSSREERLSQWMDENARVVWMTGEESWKLERAMISTICLPLNLDDNDRNEFAPVLSELRSTARARARALPILPR